jgi:UDP-N-acetyl-D-glucosamine dehydrogenase
MNELAERLRRRVADRSARIGIVGLGYVGLPTAIAFAQEGFPVIGVDRDERRSAGVNAGRSHIEDVAAATVESLTQAGRLLAVGRLVDATPLDVIDICVPTPLDKSRDPDVSAIGAVIEELPAVLAPGQLVVLTSTTYPGTTAELLQPALEAAGMRVGEDVFLAFAPERIDPGNAAFGIRNTPKVVGGVTPTCTAMAMAVFEAIIDRVVPVSSPDAAEMTKLLENTFRSVNIALANEVAIMCRQLGVDVWEVIDAAATKPYGFMPFYPGPGLGGHCIPVDPSYLSWKLRRLNYVARFVNLAEDINRHMPEYVVQRIADVLNEDSRSVRGSKLLLLGVSYKADIGDLRESPALDIITLLRRRGATVEICDPHLSGPLHVGSEILEPQDLSAELLAEVDLVVVTTAHHAFDQDLVRRYARAVFDTRGWYRSSQHLTERNGARWHSL